MRLFLDTANIEQIEQAVAMGVISGVTTNPTLAAKEGNSDYKALVTRICPLVPGPVSVEVLTEGVDNMIKQGREFAKWADNIVIKIPATADGLKVTSALAKDGIQVNFTLVFSVNQAILGARAGAAYVSPFVGRLDDIGQDGMQLIEDILAAYWNYDDIDTQVIAASVRHPEHCLRAALAGAHIATVPPNVLMQMIQHPMTDSGLSRFMSDWKKIAGK
jgi:transaldolase